MEAQADALAWYTAWRQGIDVALTTMHDRAVSGLRDLRPPLIVVDILRRKSMLRQKPTLRGLSSKRLHESYKALATLVDALSAEDYAEYGNVDQHLTRLYRSLDRERDARMREAFQRCGPPR